MLKQILGDRAVMAGMVTKLLQGISGPITAVLVLFFFDPKIQGYYYTFGSLLALQIFVELGLAGVITTFVAHECAVLSIDRYGRISGDSAALSRLAAITRYAFRWYLMGAALLLVLLLIAGIWFFGGKNEVDGINWFAPWIAICFLAAANFALTPAWAILIGCGQIVSVNNYRIVESLMRSLVIWAAIAMGASLWAAALAAGFVFLAGISFLLIRHRSLFATLSKVAELKEWNWRREIGPLQMKVGLAWLSGYFAFSLFTPAAFYFLGPAAAGQIGMTWAFVSGLSGLASTLVQVRSPRFASLVAQRKFSELDDLARKTVWFGPGICLVGAVCGISILMVLNNYRPDFALRFLPIGGVAVFMFAEVLHQASMVQSSYLRAFKKEPFFWLSWATSITIGTSTILLTPRLEGYGSALSYLAGTCVALVWGTIIFVRNRRDWTFPRAA